MSSHDIEIGNVFRHKSGTLARFKGAIGFKPFLQLLRLDLLQSIYMGNQVCNYVLGYILLQPLYFKFFKCSWLKSLHFESSVHIRYVFHMIRENFQKVSRYHIGLSPTD